MAAAEDVDLAEAEGDTTRVLKIQVHLYVINNNQKLGNSTMLAKTRF